MRQLMITVIDKSIERAAAFIAEADGLLITAGAGMGVDSGLPDFRSNEGFWNAYPALRKSGIQFQSIATPRTFWADPDLAWGFYGHRLNLYRRTIPHDGFRILKEIGEKMPNGCFVFTSNVDGQFQKAGFRDSRVCEVHGSIHHMQCMDMCGGRIWPADTLKPEVDEGRCRLVSPLPRCPTCGGVARPNILMFWDDAWLSHYTEGRFEQLRDWLRGVEKLVTIEIGAGTAIPTVRNFGQRQEGALVRVNMYNPFLPSHKEGVALKMGGLEAMRWIKSALNRSGFS